MRNGRDGRIHPARFGLDKKEKDVNRQMDEKMLRVMANDLLQDNAEYAEFTEKFKPKKTTDDCFTPPEVYAAVLDWATQEYGITPDTRIVRPFYPGGDYEKADYSGNCAVIDNPPFSILARIIDFFHARGIRYFLFAPNLTLFSKERAECNHVIANAQIIYENGANINTSFATNMGDVKIHVSGELNRRIREAQERAKREKKKELPKYAYPMNVCSAALLGKIAVCGIDLRIRTEDAQFIRALDTQRAEGKTIFGGGFLLSDRAAAERAAAIEWGLSDRERAIIEEMNRRG